MRVIEITEDKCQKMADLTEEMLHAGGKLMSCIEQLKESKTLNYRSREMRETDRYDRERYRDDDGEFSHNDWRLESRYR